MNFLNENLLYFATQTKPDLLSDHFCISQFAASQGHCKMSQHNPCNTTQEAFQPELWGCAGFRTHVLGSSELKLGKEI